MWVGPLGLHVTLWRWHHAPIPHQYGWPATNKHLSLKQYVYSPLSIFIGHMLSLGQIFLAHFQWIFYSKGVSCHGEVIINSKELWNNIWVIFAMYKIILKLKKWTSKYFIVKIKHPLRGVKTCISGVNLIKLFQV